MPVSNENMDFFFISKTVGVLSDPGNVLVLLILLATIIKLLAGRQYRPFARALTMIVVVVLAVLMFVPLGYWSMHSLETQVPSIEFEDIDQDDIGGIIVLGGSVDPHITRTHNQLAMNGSIERIFAFSQFLKRFPDKPAIFSGGSGYLGHQKLKEADIIDDVLRTQGIDVSRVMFERESRNTYENALYSLSLLKEQGMDVKNEKPWLLITSGNHMQRSKAVFEKLGWPVIAYPVDFRVSQEHAERMFCMCFSPNLNMLDKVSHEMVGLLIYDLSGRI